MPIPVLGHHDAAEVGVTAEVNAEQVKDLALVKIGGGPDRGNAVNGCIAAVESDDETQPLLQRHGKNVVSDLEARLRGVPVHSGDIFEESVAGLQDGLSSSDDVLASDRDGQFVAVKFCVGSEAGERFDCSVFRMRLKDGLLALDG